MLHIARVDQSCVAIHYETADALITHCLSAKDQTAVLEALDAILLMDIKHPDTDGRSRAITNGAVSVLLAPTSGIASVTFLFTDTYCSYLMRIGDLRTFRAELLKVVGDPFAADVKEQSMANDHG